MFLKFTERSDEDPEFSDRMVGTRLNVGKFQKLNVKDSIIRFAGFNYALKIPDEQKAALNFNGGVGFHIWHNGMTQARLNKICTGLKEFCAAQNINVVITDNAMGFPGNKVDSWFIFGDIKTMLEKAEFAEIDLPISSIWHGELLEDIAEVAKGGRKRAS